MDALGYIPASTGIALVQVGSAFEENLAAVPDALHFDPQHRAEGTAALCDPDRTGASH